MEQQKKPNQNHKLLSQKNLCLSGAQKESADVYPLHENKVFSHWNAML